MKESDILKTMSVVADEKPDSRLNLGTNRESRKTFVLRTANDYKLNPSPNHSWLVEDLLPLGGTSLLVAKPKVGKSTLLRTLSRSCITGEDFLGRAVLKRGKVLFYAFEERERFFLELLLKGDFNSEEILIHFGGAPQSKEDVVNAFMSDLIKYQPVLVILDPLQKFFRIKDLNDYAAVSNILDPLTNIATANNCHVLLSHHANKAGSFDGDEALGSTALFGSVDTLMSLRKNGETRVMKSTQRYGIDLPVSSLLLNKEADMVTLGQAIEQQRDENLRERIRKALGNSELNENDIRQAVGGNQTDTVNTIREMVDEGLLAKSGQGVRNHPYMYKLSDTAKVQLNSNKNIDESASFPNFPLFNKPHEHIFSSFTTPKGSLERCKLCGNFKSEKGGDSDDDDF